jgi:hypothetical protein
MSAAREGEIVVACSFCGQKNRVKTARIQDGPKCGRCGTRLLHVRRDS